MRTGATALAAAWLLAGSVACVDTGAKRKVGGVGGPTCEVAAPVPFMGAATIPSDDTAPPGPYQWKNVVIKGGGFVSGIVTSPALPGLTFARTDVGGAYRYDPANKRWLAITDGLGHNDGNLTGIESIATDPVDPNRVYVAAGQYVNAGNGFILSSTDMGRTWTRNAISAPMGGNADGRSMGERLAVDPNLPSTLYFGSRNAGLFRSTDSAAHWTLVSGLPANVGALNDTGGVGYGVTFVVFDPRSGAPGSPTPGITIGVGVNPGTALYRSTDAGATWMAVDGQPTGMMPHHAVLDGCGNLYITYNSGPGPNNVTAGAVWRLTMDTGAWKNVSPPPTSGGFGGISVDPAHPGTMVVSTIDNWSPGEIFRTINGGTTWAPLVQQMQRDVMGAQYLYWHGTGLPAMGWMGDIELDPFNPDRALYITGQGVWSTDDLTASDARGATHWTFDDAGLEETVALDLAVPPNAEGAQLLSGVGDIAGFRHDDLDASPPGGMFANPVFGNTSSIDFAESIPSLVVRVGSSSNGGGRGAYSTDGGTTWTPFGPGAPAVSGTNAQPANQGSIAVSADGARFVWVPGSQRGVTVTPSYSLDRGASWTPIMGLTAGARVAADRMNALKFYAGSGNRFLISTDGGATFAAPATPPPASGRPRPLPGHEGDVWLATSSSLLRSKDSGATFKAIAQVNAATAVGFGAPASGQTFPAVYLAGSVNGTWGVYRSDDAAGLPDDDPLKVPTWTRIDDPDHQFGYINILTGDPRRQGRVYIGTGGRGILYGDPR